MKLFRRAPLLLVLPWVLAVLTACGGSGSSGSANPPPPPAPPPAPPAATTSDLRIDVRDIYEVPMTEVTVTPVAGGSTATTAANGIATLVVARNQDLVFKLTKPGYAEQFKQLRVPAASSNALLDARLLRRDATQTMANIENGGTVTGRNGVRVNLPPNAVVDAQGAPVTGAIDVAMTPVNVATEEIGAFPGSFIGSAGTTTGSIATLGVAEFVLMRNGEELRIAPGSSATIDIPIYVTENLDGTPLAVGGEIPLWSLDETTGRWLQEGMGTIVASSSGTGLALRGSVTHFSWWNADVFTDDPEDPNDGPSQVTVTFQVPSGLMPTHCCLLIATPLAGAGPQTVASIYLQLPGGTVTLQAGSNYRLQVKGLAEQGPLRGEILYTPPPDSGSVTIPLAIDEDLPNPFIVSPSGAATIYTNGTLDIEVIVGGPAPDSVELRANGAFQFSISTPPYEFVWNTDNVGEGSYQVTARALLGEDSVDSQPRTVVVDRTPPQLIGRGPPPASEAGTLTPIVATFDEPLDPDSLSAAGIRLLRGGPNGSLLPSTFALSDDNSVLTVIPAEPLATNFAYAIELTGITDRAGNESPPQSWAWTVPQFALASTDLRNLNELDEPRSAQQPQLTLDGAGLPIIAWRQHTLGNETRDIAAKRLTSGGWIALPTLTATADVEELALAADASGNPVVAWMQLTPNTFGCVGSIYATQVFVARFDGVQWNLVGEGQLNTSTCSAPARIDLLIDEQDRPVVSFTENFNTQLFVKRREGNAWLVLGGGQVPKQTAGNLVVTPALARHAGTGDLYLLHAENQSGPQNYYVSRFNGTAWSNFGPMVDSGFGQNRAHIVVDSMGRVAVTYRIGPDIRVRRGSGSSWTDLGSSLGVGLFSWLALEDDEPVIAIQQDVNAFLFVRRWNDALQSWGTTVNVRGNSAEATRLLRDPASGRFWIGYMSGPFRREVLVSSADTLP